MREAVTSAAEDSHSGRVRTLGKRVRGNPSRVQIPHPPLSTSTVRVVTPPRITDVIFKRVGDGRPYPDHGLTGRGWNEIAPRQVRLSELVTTKRALDLDTLLAEDSTIFGDLFCHVIRWKGELYLEDGLHRALRAALQQRTALHARVLNLDAPGVADIAASADEAAGFAGADRGSDR